MRVLVLAPQPFYQDRGTPIDVALVLKVLSERGDQVDVVTFHEGRDIHLPHVTVHRIRRLAFVRGVRPGFSWKKVVCDALLLAKALRFMMRRRYDVVHAVEEAVFIALLFRWLFGTPYVYDMDSQLSEQLTDRYPFLAPVASILARCERVALTRATAVVPVCEALADVARGWNANKVVLLPDVSLLDPAVHPLCGAPGESRAA